jgi:hypothetical protein
MLSANNILSDEICYQLMTCHELITCYLITFCYKAENMKSTHKMLSDIMLSADNMMLSYFCLENFTHNLQTYVHFQRSEAAF